MLKENKAEVSSAEYRPSIIESWGERKILYFFNKVDAGNKPLSLVFIMRMGIILSFFVGFVITIMIALIEIYFFPEIDEFSTNIYGFSIYAIVSILLIFSEFYLLFLLGFYCVAHLIKISGVDYNLYEMRLSLSRAILEIPEPKTSRFNLDLTKYRRRSYYLSLILYKVKNLASNFIAKIIFKQLLARTSFRAYSALIAAPITGFWDALVMGLTLKEAHSRISARICVMRLLDCMSDSEKMDDDLIEILFRITAIRIELNGGYDASLDYFLLGLFERYESVYLNISDISSVGVLKNLLSVSMHSNSGEIKSITTLLFSIKNKNLTQHEIYFIQELDITLAQINILRKEVLSFKGLESLSTGDSEEIQLDMLRS